MSKGSEYQAAIAQAESKKLSFLSNLEEARARISPYRLKNDAKAKVRQKLHDGKEGVNSTVREHPVAASAAALGVAAFLMRGTLCRLFRRSYAQLKKPKSSRAELAGERLKKKLYSAASAVRRTGD